MRWRRVASMLFFCLAVSACGGGGGGGAAPAGVMFDVDLAGNLRALPKPTMGALEAI